MSGLSCPVISRISVLLPAPLAPTSPVIPGRSSSVTWLTPNTGPYHFETRSHSRSGSAAFRSEFGVPAGWQVGVTPLGAMAGVAAEERARVPASWVFNSELRTPNVPSADDFDRPD